MMQSVKLNQVCKILNGYAFKSEEYQSEGVPLLRISNFDGGDVVVDDKSIYVDQSFLKTKTDFIVEKGDILIALSGATTGKYGIYNYDFPSLLNQRIGLIKSSASSKLSGKYFYHFLNILKDEILRKAGGAAQPNISTKTIGELEIPFPPLAQQQKIANILDAADALRQNEKAIIAKFDELTQALFLDMFGDPVSNPKGFELSTVGIQCNVKGGKRVPKEEKLVTENTGFPYIKAGNIKSGKVTLKDLEYLLPQTREKLKRYIVEKGDVCITVVGVNIGDIGIVPNELHLANLTENANKILIKDKLILNNYYLAKYLQMDFVQKNISAKTMAVGVPKLALFRIEQIELLIPPIALQRQYEERVALIEEQKSIAQKSLEKSEELFNSLLQKAFKGEL